MSMVKRDLDFALVPLRIIILVTYHVWLLYRIINQPIQSLESMPWIVASGFRQWWRFDRPSSNPFNSHFCFFRSLSIRFVKYEKVLKIEQGIYWVEFWWQDVAKNGVLTVQTLRNNTMASTVLASKAIMLSSLVAVLMSSDGANAWFDFGVRSARGFSIKFFSILVCFLVAFLLNLQSIRYYSHASILINVPFKKMSTNHHLVTAGYVMRMVNRGSYIFLVIEPEGLLLLFPSIFLDLWTHSHDSLLLSPCFQAIFSRFYIWIWVVRWGF